MGFGTGPRFMMRLVEGGENFGAGTGLTEITPVVLEGMFENPAADAVGHP